MIRIPRAMAGQALYFITIKFYCNEMGMFDKRS